MSEVLDQLKPATSSASSSTVVLDIEKLRLQRAKVDLEKTKIETDRQIAAANASHATMMAAIEAQTKNMTGLFAVWSDCMSLT